VLRLAGGDGAIEGRFADLAHDGALIVDTDVGRQRFVAGDVAQV
jgi:hypothetical protein